MDEQQSPKPATQKVVIWRKVFQKRGNPDIPIIIGQFTVEATALDAFNARLTDLGVRYEIVSYTSIPDGISYHIAHTNFFTGTNGKVYIGSWHGKAPDRKFRGIPFTFGPIASA